MRLLIVEDEVKIARSLKKGLEQESYAVDIVHTGNEGLDLAMSEPYDLLILDLMLPELDGLQITKALRDKKMGMPILLLTAKDQLEDIIAGLDAGADDYVTKPFSFEEVLARVRALLRRPKKVLSGVLRVKDLTLDQGTHEVKRGGKTIKLSQRELALLEYLMRYPNTVMNKDQLIAHVWDYDADVLPNTVEVYIGYLRNKIDKPFHKKLPPLIHTIRGFGYKVGE
jgi:DNA-binding response OmpR family regulator